MNKKIVLTMVVIVIAITCVFSFTACNGNNAIYDIGEYGEVEYIDGQYKVITNEGYRFIGWREPVKQGRKTMKNGNIFKKIKFRVEITPRIL